jgi:signal transduction histidine kinase
MNILGFPWTIRTRLSLLYAGAFLLAGLALVTFMYLFLGQVLDQQFMIRSDLPIDVNAPADIPGDGADIPREPMLGTTTTRRVIDIMIRRASIDTLQTMLIASLIIVAILTVLAGIIGWLVAGQALQPLRNITGTARRVADRSLHERIALTGPQDEIKDLADTLDAMLDRLDRSFDSQRRFVANASHELRTPLTIARTLIEVALLDAGEDTKVRQLGTTLLAVNQRHEKLTDGLLTLASTEQRAADFRPVDLSEIAGQIAADMRPVADKAGVSLENNLRPGIILGDAFLLERLVQNLIENGIQYNVPEDGWVRVQTHTQDGSVELVIENTGPIVPAYEVPGLFEPFRRLAATDRLAGTTRASIVRGAGLGLSIVRSVAHAHGGTIEASPREGGGLVVRARIPAVVDAPELLTAS